MLHFLPCLAKNWQIFQGEKCQLPGSLSCVSTVSWILTPRVLAVLEAQNGALRFPALWDNPELCWLLCLLVADLGQAFSLSPYTPRPKGKSENQMSLSFKELSFFLQNCGLLNCGYLGSPTTPPRNLNKCFIQLFQLISMKTSTWQKLLPQSPKWDYTSLSFKISLEWFSSQSKLLPPTHFCYSMRAYAKKAYMLSYAFHGVAFGLFPPSHSNKWTLQLDCTWSL